MLGALQKYLELIKFSHSIFALPFALISVLVATEGSPGWSLTFWIILAMVGARSGAMGVNRLVDMKFDAQNPRTQDRPSVTGEVSVWSMVIFIALSYVLLVWASKQLNPLAFYLSPVAIFLTAFYSFTKRFTAYSHLFLGFAIGAAPIAAWIAVTGTISIASLLLGASVCCWIAGFDILYALQDEEVDREIGLNSIPQKYGSELSLWIARGLHLTTISLWFWFCGMAQLNLWFFVGVLICSGLLWWEHYLIDPNDLSNIDMAFFNMNGYISITLFVFTGLALWL